MYKISQTLTSLLDDATIGLGTLSFLYLQVRESYKPLYEQELEDLPITLLQYFNRVAWSLTGNGGCGTSFRGSGAEGARASDMTDIGYFDL